mmetsp:Transcript_8093/g.15908  ORF Transcript_8093/g.15908 Transcript_8093/m.15908 type:complete len:484 (-) Transcript_8093:6-1457(-)
MATGFLAQASRTLSGVPREPVISVEDRLKSQIRKGTLKIKWPPNDISSQLIHKSPKVQVEEKVRNMKLTEAVRTKQTLEHKLENLQGTIQVMTSMSPQPHEDEKHQKELENLQSPETLEMLKKLRQEKKERLKKLQKLQEMEQAKLQAEADAEEDRKRQMDLEAQLKRKQQLEEKQLKRLQQIEERKRLQQLQEDEIRLARQAKPLHVKLEEKFTKEVLMPQLEERKALLASKRANLVPLNKEELKEHAKRYREISKEAEERRERNLKNMQIESQMQTDTSSRLFAAALEKERQAAQTDEAKLERERLMQKAKRYGELVQELYTPRVSPIVKLPERKSSLKARSLSTKRSSEFSIVLSESPIKRKKKPTPKPKPASSEPAAPQSPPVKLDYLADLRSQRRRQGQDLSKVNLSYSYNEDLEDESLSTIERYQKVTSKIAAIERKAKHIEQVPRSIFDPGALSVEEELNNAMLSAVKAKLALLEV